MLLLWCLWPFDPGDGLESFRRCGKRGDDGNVSDKKHVPSHGNGSQLFCAFPALGFSSSPREVFPSSLPPFRPPFVLESQLSDSQDRCAEIKSHPPTCPAVRRASGIRELGDRMRRAEGRGRPSPLLPPSSPASLTTHAHAAAFHSVLCVYELSRRTVWYALRSSA